MDANELIGYLQNNPKDFINILFWIFTACLALVTYKNAKKTLFNPIRSEMVKYQMKIITEFIDGYTSKGFDFESSINYRVLLKLNYDVDYLLHLYSTEHIFENHNFTQEDSNRIKFCEDNLAGFYEVRTEKGKLIMDTATTGDFASIRQYVHTDFVKFKEEANKDLPLQRFFFTKRFYSFHNDLLNLELNPFVPEEIKKQVIIVNKNIIGNFRILFQILSDYVMEQKPVKYQDILNEFYSKKISHDVDLQNLRKQITRYFKVNKL